MYVLEWRTVNALTRGLFWCLFPELRSNKGDEHQNNTQVSAHTLCHKSAYIILFLTWQKQSANYDKTMISHSLGLCSDDDVTINYWWHHKCITWCRNCDMSTCKVISNLLEYQFYSRPYSGPVMQEIGVVWEWWASCHPRKYSHLYVIFLMRNLFCCGYQYLLESCGLFTHILQGCFTGTGAIIWLPQCQCFSFM